MTTITLRDRKFTADNPTDAEIIGLLALFLPGDSDEERISNLKIAANDSLLDLETEQGRNEAATALFSRLTNPITKARVAHTIKEVYPDIPDEWVNYQLIQGRDGRTEEKFKLKLSIREIIEIIGGLATSFDPGTPAPVKGFAQPYKTKPAKAPRIQ